MVALGGESQEGSSHRGVVSAAGGIGTVHNGVGVGSIEPIGVAVV
jgi:hypothetical protein